MRSDVSAKPVLVPDYYPLHRYIPPSYSFFMLIDLTGRQFGRWTVIKRIHLRNPHGKNARWLCKCICGKEKVIPGNRLLSGRSNSCGCFRRELARTRITHGHSGRINDDGKLRSTPTYSSWYSMKKRCLNVNDPYYQDYGGRGITVCKQWLQFENFLADMGEKPRRGMSIERLDNNQGYKPDNCIWATNTQQANNRRSNRIITIDGTSKPLVQWIHQYNIDIRDYGIIQNRLNRGWPHKEALSKPIKRKR